MRKLRSRLFLPRKGSQQYRQISVFGETCMLGAAARNEKCYIIKKKWISKSKKYLLYECVPSHTRQHFQQAEPEHYFDLYTN